MSVEILRNLPNTPEGRRLALAVDSLDQAAGVIDPAETVALEAIRARRAELITEAVQVIAETAERRRTAPRLLADHHGRVVGTL